VAFVSKEVVVSCSPEAAWDAVRDVGALHTRLVAGFVTNTRLEDDHREVTFADGRSVRELIIDIDDSARRLVYSVVGGRMTHDNAVVQVFPHEHGARIVWQRDLLPKELAGPVAASMEAGVQAMKRTLERG